MSETKIQKEIMDWLSDKGIFYWRSSNVPAFKKRVRGNSMPLGMPDICMLIRGLFVALEIKAEDGYTAVERRKTQEEMRLKIIGNGGKYYKVYSLVDVKKIVTMDCYMVGANITV